MINSLERVRRTRRALIGAIGGAAALWAALALVAATVLAGLADLVTPLPLDWRRLVLPAAALSAALAIASVILRGRRAGSMNRVALYIEERVPALQFALITAVEFPGSPGTAQLERIVQEVDPRAVALGTIRRGLARPAAALALSLLALAALPRGTRERVLRPRPGDILAVPTRRAPTADRLTPIAVRIEFPAYTRRPAAALEDPSSVPALVGSRIAILGRGAASGIDGLGASLGGGNSLGTSTLRPAVAGDTWSVTFVMPPQPAVVRLADRGEERLLTLDPQADDAPVVTLRSPKTDTTYRLPRGRIALAATADDDIGLAHAEFELLHTAGSGERFTTRRWTLGGASPSGARAVTLRASFALDTLHLSPGDVLHIRAVAWDENTVTGPDTGASDTRTIRIADPRGRDSLHLEVELTVPLDTTAISQRMLVLRAETLLLRRRSLSADSFAGASRHLGALQDDVRARVQAIINDLEDEEATGVGTSAEVSLLVGAAAAMADAEGELRPARVAAALPHMRRALALLIQARGRARRLYLRGGLPKVVIDVGRVRLKGTDPASVSPRTARTAVNDARQALLVRLDRALRLLARAAPRAGDSLTMIRVDALAQARDAAAPLGRAIDALRHGQDPGPALSEARRRLERATSAEGALSAWQGAR